MSCPKARFLATCTAAGMSLDEAVKAAGIVERVKAKINRTAKALRLTPAEQHATAVRLIEREYVRVGFVAPAGLPS